MTDPLTTPTDTAIAVAQLVRGDVYIITETTTLESKKSLKEVVRKSVGLAGSLNNFEATIKPDNPNPDANPKPTIKPDNANAHLYLYPLSSLFFLFRSWIPQF